MTRTAAGGLRLGGDETSPSTLVPPATRYYGQQWCHDCHQPATRVDLGGLCPHCDEPFAVTDLLDQHPAQEVTVSPER